MVCSPGGLFAAATITAALISAKCHLRPVQQHWRDDVHANVFPTPDDEDEEDHGNLEPISQENIIQGGRRTRGKNIDWDKVNADAMDDEEDDDEDYQAANDEDDQMRD